ncbi:SDR family NAD(P)-dependent oxidoreductase [Ornithinimicrobium tianjinense]|uniref:Ketoacyl reductase n=1 Tax=Ornithinimicrobium tianjinense TaxID=1195761 RepID=A0A917BRI0_9MICO|nr:SDR family NAD(P)-dependent oxidoreductase [Ornithinimicrobium tianjinense]GGF53745.1 ketoacyl reductase [Ornithinimicrobium tianjinense]
MNQTPTQPVALVVGGSRGLGLIIVKDLVSRGYRVALCGRDLATAEEAAREAGATAYRCDVREREQVFDLVRDVERDLGAVDVLIHVAGIIQVGPAETMTLEHFDAAVGTMLMGAVNAAWAVLPGMRERGHGRIGVVTSIGGKVSPPHLLPYATAKFGAVGFTEGLAAELAGTGVTATTLVPGLMRTGSHEGATFTGDHAAEFAWFGPAASLPLLSMDAERAARRMVDGVLDGKPVVQLSAMTHLATRFHGLSPTLTVHLMSVMNRLLPSSPSGMPFAGTPDSPASVAVPGREAKRALSTGAAATVRTLTTLGRRAADRFNQRG